MVLKYKFTSLIFLFPLLLMAQNKSYLGLELGPKFELYQATDNGTGIIIKPFFFSPILGLTLGHELNPFLIETGFYLNSYGESFRIEGEGNGYNASNAILAFQIPIRLKVRIPIIKDRLSFLPSIGYTFAINNDFESSGSSASFSVSSDGRFNDSTRVEATSIYGFEKTYGLLEAGLGFDYTFDNHLVLSMGANYLHGFKRVVELDVKYWINDGPEQTGTVYSNGGYFNIVFGLKYPIGEEWVNREGE